MEAPIAGRRANALRRELVVRVQVRSTASAEAVFDTLADLPSHLEWAGARQKPKMRLLSIEAPDGRAVVGTEFRTRGTDPTGEFRDASVVTETERPRVFEFVTEAHLETKKGKTADWTNVHRYEIGAEGSGSRITYTARVRRISALPGPLALLNLPGLSAMLTSVWARINRRTVVNLARVAEERFAAR